VSQDLHGWYNGVIEIKAKSKKEALRKLEEMEQQDIDDLADWTHGDEYCGDVYSIKVYEDTIVET
jgi:hypothetical protein